MYFKYNEKGDRMINKIYNENCLDTMARMPDNFIDLTVTSPPYDNLRKYKGYEFDFESIAKELYRVTAVGGVVVWIVGDATIKGSETGTSFKQALYFKEIGFNLHDTMIYAKSSQPRQNGYRYEQQFEYMFILSKGCCKIKNPLKEKSKNAGKAVKRTCRDGGKDILAFSENKVSDYKIKGNIWEYGTKKNNTKHPAVFPEQLAEDHIISWSNENDIVYDPMAGSGTTIKMAIRNNRNWIGSEISSEYCEIIKERCGIK
jgi:site-specific DNA-methyltransferase (adenine-specific)